MSSTGHTTKNSFPMLDMMLQMQQLGMRAMTMYQPAVSALLASTDAMERAVSASAVRFRLVVRSTGDIDSWSPLAWRSLINASLGLLTDIRKLPQAVLQ